MQIYANQLEAQLKRGLAPFYLVYGEEPLLVEEAIDAILAAARAAGFQERQLASVEPGFDWDALFASTRSLSLFSERRVIELRLPTGKPGEAGAKILIELAGAPPADTLIIVSAGKLDKQARAAKWVKSVEAAGVAVAVYPPEAAQLPAWIAGRMRAHGLTPGPGAAELIAYRIEGNLLAGAQEIEKLALLFDRGTVRADDIEGLLGDNARFDVFSLVDASRRGHAGQIVRILNSLKVEGTEPVLILWALAREARLLAQLAADVAAGVPAAQAMETQRVWGKHKPLVAQALKRGGPAHWQALLLRAARLDRVIKGRAAGDAWQALECMALALGGVRLATCA